MGDAPQLAPKAACPTVLLSDRPTSKDVFNHKDVANAIFRLIEFETGGKAIGLEGTWGSGKSTVVEILREKLGSSSKKVEVFVFDAWAHQGDPLRRSFLERLILHLTKTGWVDTTKWEAIRQELTRQSQTTETTTEPTLRKSALFLAISLLGLPFFFSLLIKLAAGEGHFQEATFCPFFRASLRKEFCHRGIECAVC